MKSLSIKVITKQDTYLQPVPIYPPENEIFWGLHDFMCNDPRHGQTEGYVSRTWKQKVPVPAAFKYDGGKSKEMDYGYSKLWRDSLGLYAPQRWKTQPADLNDGNDWSWLRGFIPKCELDKWHLHMVHGARFGTNKTGPNDIGFQDEYTGYGTPDENGNMTPYKKEPVDLTGNYYWRSSGNRFWCLDGFAPAPEAEQLRDNFFLLHICTQSSPDFWDSTKRPEIGCPKGIWEILDFPQAGGNIAVHPMISLLENGATMSWNGLNLREGVMDVVRLGTWPMPSLITWPYIPNRTLVSDP